MKRWLCIVAVGLLLTVLLSACGTKENADDLEVLGTWTQTDGTALLVLDKNGKGRLMQNGKAEHAFTYTVSNKKSNHVLTMTGKDGTFEYFYEMTGEQKDQLTLTGSEGQVVTLVRAKA